VSGKGCQTGAVQVHDGKRQEHQQGDRLVRNQRECQEGDGHSYGQAEIQRLHEEE